LVEEENAFGSRPPANSKFKIRFLFRQSLKNREKRTSFFFVIYFRGIRVGEEVSFFNTHKSLCRGAKVMGCAQNNNLGFSFGYFSQRNCVGAGYNYCVGTSRRRKESPSSLCEIEQKMTRLSFIGLFLLIGKNLFLFFVFLCLDTQSFVNFVAPFLLQFARSCPKRSIFSLQSVFIFWSV
jgi:hypothetical protein